jgi:hypothetical protein
MHSKKYDGDKFFFAVTEHTNDVAMVLIDENDEVHVNADARSALKRLWESSYEYNIKALIPVMAEQLDMGFLSSFGVKERTNCLSRFL